eukprot:TRINITY_DN5255_c0_g1_i1.p1 TRINITY_DN5255_c0_g1~~TRINITY_DN5255_c0_g1_i1.p1  ORF type:complete len:257 (+),score=26.72 TRINITY_DN5255_c0_g1_i1:48-773(+)
MSKVVSSQGNTRKRHCLLTCCPFIGLFLKNKSQSKPLGIIISGAPGSGKGTQCEKIVEKYGLVHISVGDLLRAEVQAKSPIGLQAKGYMDEGKLVPDEVVVDMVAERLAQKDVQEKGFLLDGFPRTAVQAEALQAKGISPNIFILIEVPDDALIERIVGRRMDPETGIIYHLQYKPPPKEIQSRLIQRSDDTAEKLKTRLESYNNNVNAVVGHYEQCLVKLDGNRPVEEVFDQIQKSIDSL